ncbi:MAG: redoxin domain-containing protein [Bacteroidales bacterium]|nr:redoxin domain-containing protein [Bacteroidales bacterium]
MNRIFFLFILLIFTIACQNEKRDIEKILSYMINKEIVFPNTIQSKILGRDTLTDILNQPNYKIITYIDSMGCTDCRLNLFEWRARIKEIEKWSVHVDVIFIFQPRDEKELLITLKHNQIDFPVFYDGSLAFVSQNQLPMDTRYSTFLVDRANRIRLVGNPLYNSKMWDMYKNVVENAM